MFELPHVLKFGRIYEYFLLRSNPVKFVNYQREQIVYTLLEASTNVIGCYFQNDHRLKRFLNFLIARRDGEHKTFYEWKILVFTKYFISSSRS